VLETMDNGYFSDWALHDKDERETCFSISAVPSSSQESDSTYPRGTNIQLDDKRVVDNTVQEEGKTVTRPMPFSSSHEDDSVAERSMADVETRFIPICGLVFCVMTFFGFLCAYAMDVCLSVAIVAMVNHTALNNDVELRSTANINDTDQCPHDQALQHADGEFIWDRHQQGAALAMFSYGHIITQVRKSFQPRRVRVSSSSSS